MLLQLWGSFPSKDVKIYYHLCQVMKLEKGLFDVSVCFGYIQEAYIAELDAKSGASLKLTILNSKGRIWTMVAGGGASVVYR